MATLQYNDTSGLQGIIQAEEDYTGLGDGGISGDITLKKVFTRYNNSALSKIWTWIFWAHGDMSYDDGNKTNLPSAAQDLTSGTQVYALPSEALTVKGVDIKLPNSSFWQQLTPITEEEIRRQDAEGNFQYVAGVPQYYRIIGSTVKLYPSPNYTSSGGFKVSFDRGSVAFSAADTTATPGFASEYHNAVAVGGALEWLRVNKPNSTTIISLLQDWRQYELDIKAFYSHRFPARPQAAFGQRITNSE